MTQRISLTFSKMAGAQAGLGRAGSRHVITDRPEGVAGGQGLGFNGAELLAAAFGGCFWNDLHYAAEAASVPLVVEEVAAEVELAGTPPRVVRAFVTARLSGAPEAGLQQAFDDARDTSTISNSLAAAVPVQFTLQTGPADT